MFRYTLEKRQACWTCQAEFMASTSNQFTDTQHVSPLYQSRWAWLAFIKCWMKAGRVKREIEKAHKPLRLANGWAAICLLLLFTLTADASDRKSRGRGAWAWSVSANPPSAETTKPAVQKTETSECTDALEEVNKARASRGLPPFKHDAKLTQAALACARERASRGIHGHLESDFVHLPAGVSTNGVAAGCAALEPSWGWQSCCWDDPQYTTAGAAWVMSGGLRYMHIFCQNDSTQSAPQVYQHSTVSAGTCADGSCGTVTGAGGSPATWRTTRGGIFRRR